MRVIVCGSRGWTDRELIQWYLAELVIRHSPDYPIIVHGGAPGADRLCEDEARKAGLLTELHRPDFDAYPKRVAPLKRNEHMAALGADLCIAFWDGRSTGTQHMMDRAREAGIPVHIAATGDEGTSLPPASTTADSVGLPAPVSPGSRVGGNET